APARSSSSARRPPSGTPPPARAGPRPADILPRSPSPQVSDKSGAIRIGFVGDLWTRACMTPRDGTRPRVTRTVAVAPDARFPRGMPRQIRFNAFDMNCVVHQASGLWRHPRDRSREYNTIRYWTDLAQLLERGTFDGLFIADVLGTYDVYG